MKIKLTAEKLRELGACSNGLKTFTSAHGESEVTILAAYMSNGWDDIWWYISSFYDDSPAEFKSDLRLLSADYAEHVLHIFETEHPDNNSPRKAIKASRDYANGLIDESTLEAARSSAVVAVRDAAFSSARDAARSAAAAAVRSESNYTDHPAAFAARSAAWSAERDEARSAPWSAVRSAARSAEMKWQKEKLKNLLEKWS